MDKKVKIFDIEIDKYTKKQAVKKLIEFVESDGLNIVDFINMDTLSKGQEIPELRDAVKVFDMVLPGDAAVLQAMGADEEESPLTEFFQYMRKRHKKVFVVAQTEESLAICLSQIREQHALPVAGGAILPSEIEQEEGLINEINAAVPDCVLAAVPSPLQEAFIIRNYTTMNTRMWIGCTGPVEPEHQGQSFGRIRHFFKWKLFQHKVEKEKQISNT
ncbi:MAG: WecB/TagA/CpsF family glycosyltransferase [Hespellia sp.]|nr:WecB/TagA/CpsF family glycosyltransferase [Hespellia sp.]